jgi:tRNA threonylcarbamoyladenosine biosynthesis protein TsaB
VLVLAVDTATSLVVVSVHDGTTLVAGASAPARQSHAEVLAPLIHDVINQIDRTALTHVVAGVGPGPFTGLRVGIVTADVMAHALGIPAIGICSLDAVARAHGSGDNTFTVLTDARRREVYAATYAGSERIDGPHVIKPVDLQSPRPYIGEGAALYAEVLNTSQDKTNDDTEPVRMTPESLGAVATRAVSTGTGLPMTPLYLRRPDVAEPTAPKSVLALDERTS